jgi:stage V sporulation protein R
LALEAHIDAFKGVHRDLYPKYRKPMTQQDSSFRGRFHSLPGEDAAVAELEPARIAAKIPPSPEHDLLWFIANYAPELEGWERNI